MPLADALPDPIKDDVTIYELPGLNLPDSVVLPVIHGFWATRPAYSYYMNRFEEFGIPFYVALTKDEQSDYEKIYDKIRRKYSQFSDAEELRSPSQPIVTEEPPAITTTVEDETASEEEEMEEVVLTRRDIHPAMVTIRVQQYSRPAYSYKLSEEVEMPTTVDSRVSELTDLREFLRPPPPARMLSVAPSAMESVHSHILTPPPQPAESTTDPSIFEDVSELYSGQHGTFITQQHSPPRQDLDDTLTEEFEDGLDETQAASSELHFTGSDMIAGSDGVLADDERHFSPDMMDSDDSEENLPPSQIGIEIGRQHAPSPAGEILPSYTELYPSVTTSVDNDVDDLHTLKFGDALICEWSDGAYQHVFNSSTTQVHWRSFSTWIDPKPPPPSPTPKKLNLDLEDCLDEFAKEEELGQDDLWYCPRCKEHRQAKKTLELWRVPDILVVHLKRFSANRGFRDKLDNLIEFPLTDLDLSDRVGDKKWIEEEGGGEKLIYDLFAVDNHFGGLGGGHYTAHALNFVDGKWYYFDGISSLFLGRVINS